MMIEPPDTQLLDNLSTAIVILDTELCLVHINAAAEALLELSGTRQNGGHVSQLLQQSDSIVAMLLETLASGQLHTQREAVLYPFHGKPVTVDFSVTPTDDFSGGVLILEIQPIERLLRISREETLFSAQESTHELLKGMAHEIKNPLGGLRGAAQLLETELDSDELREYTQIIIHEADRLRNLVDRMLTPSQPRQRQKTNIHEVLERVRQLTAVDSNHAIRLNRDYDPSIPELMADSEGLIQATLNIARNAMQALQHSDTASPTINFRTRVLRQFTIGTVCHRLVCSIQICDNGPGIPSELQEKIFIPMVSGDARSSGLGLSISQSIVNRHHGLIAFDSTTANTCFTIYLPLETDS